MWQGSRGVIVAIARVDSSNACLHDSCDVCMCDCREGLAAAIQCCEGLGDPEDPSEKGRLTGTRKLSQKRLQVRGTQVRLPVEGECAWRSRLCHPCCRLCHTHPCRRSSRRWPGSESEGSVFDPCRGSLVFFFEKNSSSRDKLSQQLSRFVVKIISSAREAHGSDPHTHITLRAYM